MFILQVFPQLLWESSQAHGNEQTWAAFQDPGSAIFVTFERPYMLFIVRTFLSHGCDEHH